MIFQESDMDRILIRDLELSTVIGIFPEERIAPQKVVLNLELGVDLRKAGASDDFRDALDYSALESLLVQTAKTSSFQLLERLAEELAKVALSFEQAEEVRLTLDKPGAPKYARSIAVSIERKK